MRQMQLRGILDVIQPGGAGFLLGAYTERWLPIVTLAGELDAMFQLITRVQSKTEYRESVWPPIWLTVERELWDEVKQELTDEDDYDHEAWHLDYPYGTEWLGVRFRRYEGVWSVYHPQLPASWRYDPRTQAVSGFTESDDEEVTQSAYEYLTWIAAAVTEQLQAFLADPEKYNAFAEAHVPNRERVGQIRRRDLWQALPSDHHYLRDELRPDEVDEFVRIAPELVDFKPIAELTRDAYLHAVALCYAGAGYEGLDGLSPLAQYRKRADGRHDGLLDLPGDSAAAMAEWLTGQPRGGHPWEIARGGNTTHISLYVMKHDGGYALILEGSARTRAAETIRMALALVRAGIPFQLRDATHLAKMAQGEDWVGIVPRHEDGYAATQLFPAQDEVNDILSYAALEDYPGVDDRVRWHPVEPVRLVTQSSASQAES